MPLIRSFFIFYILTYSAQASACLILTCSCSLSVVNINFGSVIPYDSTPEVATGTVRVICSSSLLLLSQNVTYTLTFSAGQSGSSAARNAKAGTNIINYNIYKDSIYTQILGNGTGGTNTISKTSSIPSLQTITDTYTIYSRIPVQPLAVKGTYTDSLTLNLTYQ